MADSLSLVLVFLIGSGPAVVSCNLSDKEAESLVLTAQVTKYRPVLAPVAGIVGGGRTQRGHPLHLLRQRDLRKHRRPAFLRDTGRRHHQQPVGGQAGTEEGHPRHHGRAPDSLCRIDLAGPRRRHGAQAAPRARPQGFALPACAGALPDGRMARTNRTARRGGPSRRQPPASGRRAGHQSWLRRLASAPMASRPPSIKA